MGYYPLDAPSATAYRPMKLYLEITRDIYQLPIAVADSPHELAWMCGTTNAVISSMVTRTAKGEYRRPRYIVVEIDEEEEPNDNRKALPTPAP